MEPAVLERLGRFLETDRRNRCRPDKAQKTKDADGADGPCALQRSRYEERRRQDNDQQVEPGAAYVVAA